MTSPDIEIYAKNLNINQISTWLSRVFSQVDLPELDQDKQNQHPAISGYVFYEKHSIPIVITPKAAGKLFTSIWFKSDKTPWTDDEACALKLLESYDIEVRCSATGWTENEEQMSEQWLCITRNEKRLTHWG
jgi:hypothetical protein